MAFLMTAVQLSSTNSPLCLKTWGGIGLKRSTIKLIKAGNFADVTKTNQAHKWVID